MIEFDLVSAQRHVFTSTLKPLERLVALAICDFYSRKSPNPFPGVSELSFRTGLDRKAVMRAVRGLETAGAIRVAREPGLSNRYELARLMALPARDRDQSPRDTGPSETPVPVGDVTSPSGGTTTSPSGGTLRNPLKEPSKEPKIPEPYRLEVSTSVGEFQKPKTRGAKKPKAPAFADGAHKQVTDCYCTAFEAQHGRKPAFDGSDGSAVNRLLGKLKGDPAEACRRVRNAFASWRAGSVTIRDIASKPDAFASAEAPRGGVGVQKGPNDADLIARMRAQGATT
ncbi:MAG: helix-turn-helix domain-containing protein [Polyangiaceae bacterium]